MNTSISARRLLRVGVPSVLLLALVLALVLTIHTVGQASAAAASQNTSPYRYGPFAVTGDQDTGTCGSVWALDNFNRTFTVDSKDPAYFNEAFTKGTFTTNAGPSEGACATGTNNGNTVGAGVTGTISGNYYNVFVTGGTYNPAAQCSESTCNTTGGFVTTIYGANATYTVNSYDFDYHTAENGSATQDSSDLGGYYGDVTGPVVGASNPVQHHAHIPGQ